MYTAKHSKFYYSAGEEETGYWETHNKICQIFQFCIFSSRKKFSKIYDYIHEFKSNGPFFSVFLPLFLSATMGRVSFFLERISQLDLCDTVVSLISLIFQSFAYSLFSIQEMLGSIMGNTTVFFSIFYALQAKVLYRYMSSLSSPDLCHQSRQIPTLLIPVNGNQVEQFQG